MNKSQISRFLVTLVFLGFLAVIIVLGTYRVAGIGVAASISIDFLILAGFAIWASKRTAVWRAANPGVTPSSPFVPIGGPRPVVATAIVLTAITLLLLLAFHMFHL